MENVLQAVLVPKPRIIAQPTTADSLVSSWQLVWWYAVGGIFKYIYIYIFLISAHLFLGNSPESRKHREARCQTRLSWAFAFPPTVSVFMPYFVWTPDLFTCMQVVKKNPQSSFSPLHSTFKSGVLRGASRTQWHPADSKAHKADRGLLPCYTLRHPTHNTDSRCLGKQNADGLQTRPRTLTCTGVYIHARAQTHTRTMYWSIHEFSCAEVGKFTADWTEMLLMPAAALTWQTQTDTRTHTHTHAWHLKGAHSNWLDLQLFFFRCQSIPDAHSSIDPWPSDTRVLRYPC